MTTLTTLDGDTRDLSDEAIAALRTRMTGCLLRPGDDGYDGARAIWNGMIDKRPALIARCANADDVAAAMALARDTAALVSVRGGGHNIAGNAVTAGGLMIDLSGMNRVGVDPETGRVHVQPGATLADLDAATAPHGLAVPVGINSTTGISGLTLGDGFGWLTRAHGPTVDSLVSAEVVTASGERLRAAEDENPDLFWALRGGGGNFGIVTRFEFQARQVRPELLSGLIFLPLERARELFALQRELMREGPDELTTWLVLRTAPPMSFLPEASHGTGIAMMAFCYAGDPGRGRGGDRAVARDPRTARRGRGRAAIHLVPADLRPAADAGRAELLEVARPARPRRRRDRRADRPGVGDLRGPPRRRHVPRRAGRHGLRPARAAFRGQHPHPLAGPGEG